MDLWWDLDYTIPLCLTESYLSFRASSHGPQMSSSHAYNKGAENGSNYTVRYSLLPCTFLRMASSLNFSLKGNWEYLPTYPLLTHRARNAVETILAKGNSLFWSVSEYENLKINADIKSSWTESNNFKIMNLKVKHDLAILHINIGTFGKHWCFK